MLYTFPIDLKLTPEENVKILEIGQPLQSGANGYEQAYGHCMIRDVITPFYERYLGLPAFSMDPRAKRTERLPLGEPHIFKLTDWRESKSLYDSCAAKFPEKPGFDKDTTSSYSGIVSPFYLEGFYSAHRESLRQQHVAVVNDSRVFAGVAHSKFLQNQFFTPHIGSLAPQETAVRITSAQDMAAKIRAEIASEKIVLKLPTAARGEGVIVAERENIDKVLEFLVSKPATAADKSSPDPSLSASFNHRSWRRGEWQSAGVIVAQSFEQSAPVINEKDGQAYAPTMRAFVSLWKEKGAIKFALHGCYWKFPAEPLEPKESSKSSISASPLEMPGGKVSREHRDIVAAQLEKLLPAAVRHMDTLDMADVIRDCLAKPHDLRLLAIRQHIAITRDDVLERLSDDEIRRYAELLADDDVRTGAFITYHDKTKRPVMKEAIFSHSDKVRHMGQCYADRVEKTRQHFPARQDGTQGTLFGI